MEPTMMLPQPYQEEVERMSRLIRPGAVFRYTLVNDSIQPTFEMDILKVSAGRVTFAVNYTTYVKNRYVLAMNLVDCLGVCQNPVR